MAFFVGLIISRGIHVRRDNKYNNNYISFDRNTIILFFGKYILIRYVSSKNMFKTIGIFFKEFIKNEVGVFNSEAEKFNLKWSIYFIIGIILSIIIPICFVYIEVGQFDWNVFKFIWGEETENLYADGLYRGGYFICGICSCLSFTITGFLTTYRINGNKTRLDMKQIARMFFIGCFVLGIVCFIMANILY